MTKEYDMERLKVLAEQTDKAASEYEAAHGKEREVSSFAEAARAFLATVEKRE